MTATESAGGIVVPHVHTNSAVFPGTRRRWWVFVPAQYRSDEPAGLMVFQDGHAWLDPAGSMRTTVVLDRLIHNGEIPVTIGVFVDPGIFDDDLPEKLGWDPPPANRSVEYDTPGGAYAEFPLSEILPAVTREYAITDDPGRWAIGGMSSGGIAAFTAAWERPDRFRRVLSCHGSFTDIRGGDCYPAEILAGPPKPLRVFLQAARRDIGFDQPRCNWYSANLRMAAALAERGYDHRIVLGDGGHDPGDAGAALPDALRWLLR